MVVALDDMRQPFFIVNDDYALLSVFQVSSIFIAIAQKSLNANE